MKLRLLPGCFFAFVLSFSGTAGARADDLQAMAGTWIAEAVEAGGKPVDAEHFSELVVTISGDRYTVKTKDGLDAGSLKLDETQKPKTMDATDTEGENVGKVIQAIYELTGDTMRVCYAFTGGPRPTELATKDDSLGWLLITYKREK